MTVQTSVKSCCVEVLNAPTKVFTVGGDIGSQPKELILIIPGNPGLGGFYIDFMETFYNNLDTKVPVWCISHAGHYDLPGVLPLKGNEDVYSLNGQIRHKISFLKEFLPSCSKITFIGHSIGCKIIMDIMLKLSREDPQIHVHKSYCLFPTIERMKQTPAGKITWIQVAYFATLLSWISALLNLLPTRLKQMLVSLHVSIHSCCFQAALDVVNRISVANACYMGYTELLEVNEPDIDSLKRFSNKLRFYNGSNDQWCPVEYSKALKEKVPEMDVEMCTKNIPHAFVLEKSNEVAQIVSEWYREDAMLDEYENI